MRKGASSRNAREVATFPATAGGVTLTSEPRPYKVAAGGLRPYQDGDPRETGKNLSISP
jgi:hypothetical protein